MKVFHIRESCINVCYGVFWTPNKINNHFSMVICFMKEIVSINLVLDFGRVNFFDDCSMRMSIKED